MGERANERVASVDEGELGEEKRKGEKETDKNEKMEGSSLLSEGSGVTRGERKKGRRPLLPRRRTPGGGMRDVR